MPTLEFRLISEFIALNDLLKATGVVPSGGTGKALVAAGNVRVDGAVELRKTCKIRAGQTVEIRDMRILVQGAAAPR
jgi:ribosome-associated protein